MNRKLNSKVSNQSNRVGMTLMEVLLVVSMVSIISVSLYQSFSAGIKIWQKSRQLLKEEDIVIFLDKLSDDLRKTYNYSKISAEGNPQRFLIPAIVHTPADPRMGLPEDSYIDQMGTVEYYFSYEDKSIYRRQANYGQSMMKKFEPARKMVSSVNTLEFQYFYLTDAGEKNSDEVFEYMPFGVEVKIEFSDKFGTHMIRRFIDIPLNT